MKKIAISTTSFGEFDPLPIELCKKRGFDIVTNPYKRTVKPDELVLLARDAVGLIAGTEPITGDVLAKIPSLRVISRCGTGLDNVDLAAAERASIKVYNTPDAPTDAVAELAVGLMLGMLRNIAVSDRQVRAGVWQKKMGRLLSGKVVGIIGFGRIGRKVGRLLKSFSCDVVCYDINSSEGAPGIRAVALDELFLRSDIVTLHVSGGSSRCMIGERELKMMKKGSYIVNTSRGGTVDEEALFRSLRDGLLGGAALDVFGKEPYSGPLAGLDNVVLTPHIGSYAREARISMENEAMLNLLRGLEETR